MSTTTQDRWKQIQAVLGTAQDGIPGSKDAAALESLRQEALRPADSSQWHAGKASSFADPADIRAFRRCKAQGKSDQECFKVGDNGIGKWGADTTAPTPMCALPPEDWNALPRPQGSLVRVQANGQEVMCELQDTMPHRANIRNGAVIDLNEAAVKALGLVPPIMVEARWRWA